MRNREGIIVGLVAAQLAGCGILQERSLGELSELNYRELVTDTGQYMRLEVMKAIEGKVVATSVKPSNELYKTADGSILQCLMDKAAPIHSDTSHHSSPTYYTMLCTVTSFNPETGQTWPTNIKYEIQISKETLPSPIYRIIKSNMALVICEEHNYPNSARHHWDGRRAPEIELNECYALPVRKQEPVPSPQKNFRDPDYRETI